MSRGTRAASAVDTIVAVATAPGAGAIGVVRVSGPRALPCASPLLCLRDGATLASARPRVLTLARVQDPATGSVMDEALVVVMPAPRSYTGEDVVEISCHGNPVLLAEVVRLVTAQGARLAEPGEFTRRAYLNGRMDLVQAEAVALLIGARTERALELAARQVAGALSAEILALREAVLDLVAGLEVSLDFPEDQVGLSRAAARDRGEGIAARLRSLGERTRRGRAVNQGLSVMIAGVPNVGKSSLLNALLGRGRAIVSPEPGTTRDLLDGSLVLEGVPLLLMDGAGLGLPRDALDFEGMRRSLEAVEFSDLVIVVLDRSRPITGAEREVLRLTATRRRLVVANKTDLSEAWVDAEVDCVCSALTGAGVPEVLGRLGAWAKAQSGDDAEEGGIVASFRVMERLGRSCSALDRAAAGLRSGLPLEVTLVDLREALEALEETVGIHVEDALLDRIFAEFCVGK